jgi:hypothetical protein
VARRATPAWIEAALAEAVAAEDADRAAMLLGLAADLGLETPAGLRDDAQALVDASEGLAATAGACVACMADVAACPSLRLVAACALPFEMTPLGDANALRRQGFAWAAGGEVDRLETGLALVGLGATGAALATGGASLMVKAGAGLLRTARRMGSVTPGLARTLELPIAWRRLPGLLRGTERVEDVTDATRLAALGGVAADLGRVRAATGTADALWLLRVVDGPEDAARLARVAEAAGPDTRRAVEVLGKGRVLRATLRLSNAALGTLALIGALLLQLAGWVGARLGAVALRSLARAA